MNTKQQNIITTTTNQTNENANNIFRILALDGGGAKGFYSLGVLKEIESMIDCPLRDKFDLIFGTSTGAIISSLIALGHNVDSIIRLYREHVPTVMKEKSAKKRSRALEKLSQQVFGDATFEHVGTGVGIVATKWLDEKPMIFKGSAIQAHGRTSTFTPGFGVKIADAIQASCSAYPFFERKIITTSLGEKIELIDGGYCANNPSLYAIADAVHGINCHNKNIRLVSIGVGIYPAPKPNLLMWLARRFLVSVQLLQKTLEINTQSMEQLRRILFRDVPTIRINDTYTQPEMATDLLEHDLEKLDSLFQRGRASFSSHEHELREFLL